MCISDYKIGHHTDIKSTSSGAGSISLAGDPRRMSVMISCWDAVFAVYAGTSNSGVLIGYVGRLFVGAADTDSDARNLVLTPANAGRALYGELYAEAVAGSGQIVAVEVIAQPELDKIITNGGGI